MSIINGYTAAERDAILASPAIPVQRACCCCGRTDSPIENHHAIPRSLGGEDGPTVPVCKRCHSAGDGYEVKLIPPKAGIEGSVWRLMPLSEEYADYLGKLRHSQVHLHAFYPLFVYDEATDEVPFEESISEDEAEFVEFVGYGEKSEHLAAAALHRMSEAMPGGSHLRLRVMELLDDDTISSPWVTKTKAWGSLPFYPGMGKERGYKVARMPAEQREDAIAYAERVASGETTWSAFDADIFGDKPFIERDDKCVCATCGKAHVKGSKHD